VSVTKDPAYWQALGEFIEAFAGAETMLFNYLVACAGMSHKAGRAIIGGSHQEQLIGMIRRLWATNPPDADIMEKAKPALDQFSSINTVRNSLVHYSSFVTSDKGRVSSSITRAHPGEAKFHEYRISDTILNDMTADLGKISHHFTYCLVTTIEYRRFITKAARDDLANGLPALNAAWRYKHS
jgi:hypothetical protein